MGDVLADPNYDTDEFAHDDVDEYEPDFEDSHDDSGGDDSQGKSDYEDESEE
jgi:hypothetical protein